jgi:hypothetical protein
MMRILKVLLAVAITGAVLTVADGAPAAEIARESQEKPMVKAPTVIKFGAGQWDPSKWTPIRMANQAQLKTLVQREGALGTTFETFKREDYNAETDNAISLYDLGATEAEIAVTVSMGKGFGGNSCPGLCIAPRVKDGVLDSAFAIFIADYTMAVWHVYTDKDGKSVRYKHLIQLGRGFDPAKPHVLRCRISRKEQAVAIQADNSDPVVFTFVGNPMYGVTDMEINSFIGLWGCHGETAFHDMTITTPGTLPFLVRDYAKQ